jgi:hypothetical protein
MLEADEKLQFMCWASATPPEPPAAPLKLLLPLPTLLFVPTRLLLLLLLLVLRLFTCAAAACCGCCCRSSCPRTLRWQLAVLSPAAALLALVGIAPVK